MNTELLPLIGAVLVASVVGSLHCAGMCGAFVAMAVGLDTPVSKTRLHAAYNGGRLVIYSTIGALAGSIGGVFDLGTQAIGLQRGAVSLAAATMIMLGLVALLSALGVRVPRFKGPKLFERIFVSAHRLASRFGPVRRAFIIGLLTGLLPCGWLYAFALLAAGTGSPLTGTLVMAAFWTGTLPVLISLGAGVRALSGLLGRYAPGAMACVIIGLGIFAASGRATRTFADFQPAEPRAQAPNAAEPVSLSIPTPNGACCSQEDKQ